MSDPTSRLNAALEGRYRIERELGEGGMANVYLADDLKHERKVALKVLKPELAAIVGAERFLAEIKTTANLSHPHILPLFDSGEADGFLFYVMPHVEGETLRDRLDRDHQLPVNDAVQIAKNVAEALDYAHAQGVIHRDIKPANILLQAGKPVISDFGIALAVGTAGQGRLTETGLSMGTPHYMSPEQATGDLSVGAATDIYALGCVLYEMLVGEPPYTGSTAQAILGKIIAGELATATKQRASVPANVDAAIRRALEKLPADRFTGAHDFARALADPGFRYGEGAAVGAGPWKRVAIALGAVALLSTVGLGWSLVQGEADPTSKTVRFGIPVRQGAGASPDGGEPRYGRRTATDLAFSPDGETLVYASQRDGAAPPYLYTQRLDQDRADVIEAAGPGDQPFFSPDGAWIGFVGFGGPGEPSRPLKRISVADGTVETIAEMPVSQSPLSTGITWGDDGTIVVATGFERRDVEYSSLQRVEASGGEWEVLAETDPPPGQSWRFGQPHMLPGSETLLFHLSRSYDPEQADIIALDLASETQKTLLTNAMDPRFVRTGHLLFTRHGTLMAVAFDAERVEVLGQPVVVVEDVMQSVRGPNILAETGAAQVAVSAVGHLAYVRGGVWPQALRVLIRITSTGDTVRLEMEARDYVRLRGSPDGLRVAATSRHGRQGEVWLHDLRRGTTERLNTGGFRTYSIAWSPDGRSIAYSSDRDQANLQLYRIPADGGGEPERLTRSDRVQYVSSWSSDGVIAFLEDGDIWALAPEGEPAPFFTSEAREMYPTFSPDGRWIAYSSDRSGRDEVYVRPYPGPDPATRISSDGGVAPAWSRDGDRLFFRTLFNTGESAFTGESALMVVDVAPGDAFGAGRPEPLIVPWEGRGIPVRGYDVFSDGSFLTSMPEDPDADPREELPTELRVILNFSEELKARVPN